MSKHLIKIISICALIVLFPLVVVGASVCATEAIGCTLTILEGGNEGEYFESNDGHYSKVAIFVDGKEQKGNKIQVTKYTEVTVTYEGKGYDFIGWYKGNFSEINLENDDKLGDTSYTFEVNKNTTLTAVRDVKKYNVTYNYDDGSTFEETLTYNQSLKPVEPKGEVAFLGWSEKVGENISADYSMRARFENSTVSLVPAWANQMVVRFMDGDKVLLENRISENQIAGFKFPDATKEEVKNAITKGYTFGGWVDQEGNVVTKVNSYDPNGLRVYLKKNAIEYTVRVAFNALEPENITVVSYNANKTFDYNVQRDNYKLAGFMMNDTKYATGEKLAEAIIAGEETTVEVTAVWESLLPGITFNFQGIDQSGKGVKGDRLNGDSNVYLRENELHASFEDKDEVACFDLTDKIDEYFLGQYTNFKDSTGTSARTFTNKIVIVVDGTYNMNNYSADLSFASILNFIDEAYEGGLDAVTSLTIKFMFN